MARRVPTDFRKMPKDGMKGLKAVVSSEGAMIWKRRQRNVLKRY